MLNSIGESFSNSNCYPNYNVISLAQMALIIPNSQNYYQRGQKIALKSTLQNMSNLASMSIKIMFIMSHKTILKIIRTILKYPLN